MSLQASLSRRDLLGLAFVSAAGGLLAACGGSPPPAAGSAKASPAASVASTAPGTQPALKVVYPAVTGAQAPLWLGQELHFFEQQGVKVSAQFMESNISTKALIAKEVDVLLQAAASMITADLNGGADLVYVASAYNHAQFSLIAPAGIKSTSDLKGKVWGTDKPGTTIDYFTQLLLRLIGLKPSDVELRELGAADVLVADLLSGQIQGAPVSPPAAFNLEAQGFHSLRDTYDQPYQNVGLVISKARLPELTPALLRFLPAYRQGMQAYTQQPDVAKRVLQQYGKITDAATLQRSYDFYVKETSFQLDLQPTLPGIQYMLDFLSSTIPAAKTAKPEQFIDTRLLGQLPKD
ncbi:MAG TPA: ABC transporter substrate-binding protein [Chloroflexota bacterium]